MSYIESLEVYQMVNIFAFLIGLTYGVVAQKTQFCFSGAIKDFILTKSTRRAASVLTAVITAIIASQVLAHMYEIDLAKSVYLQADVNYFSILLGGALFGVGMMIADGCSSRHLVKFAQGDLYSLVTIVFIAVFGYISAKGILSIGLEPIMKNEFLLQLSAWFPNQALPIYVIVPFLLVALWIAVPRFKSLVSCIDGILVGLLIALAWYVTGVVGFDDFEPLPLEALSFVYPSGKTLEYLMFFSGSTLSFSVSVVFGIVLGAFVMSFFNKKYRFGCVISQKNNKLKNGIFGGMMMGIGGIMAIGCTIGQGLSGVSTLAFASFLAITSIMISAYFTAKYMDKRDALPNCFNFDWSI
ncbi:MAG: YeeE/YedE family protein [Epsilonproteobacteria bacterium]|nr:YeeE/YedE family protein [Campylobacterota bacterium]